MPARPHRESAATAGATARSRQPLPLWGVRPDPPCTGLAWAVEPAPGDFDASKGDRSGQRKSARAGCRYGRSM
jgi:hypothetical protein